jgi:hypothetical protein
MTSADSRDMVKYLARCALPPDRSLLKTDQNGVAYTFPGSFGIAPGWQYGSCDATCQEQMTACLMAMANRDGKRVEIDLVSPIGVIGMATDELNYPLQEGAVFGNLFVTPPKMFTCSGSAPVTKSQQAGRFCIESPKQSGPSGADCALFTNVGSCASKCTMSCAQGPSGAQVCTPTSCVDDTGVRWNNPITVYMKNSILAANYSEQRGISVADFDYSITNVDHTDYVRIPNVDFGSNGSVKEFRTWAALNNSGNSIEAHLDSLTGALIASQSTYVTGVQVLLTAPVVQQVSGVHDVFVYFKGSPNNVLNGNVNWWGYVYRFEWYGTLSPSLVTSGLGGAATDCATAYSQGSCSSYVQGTKISYNGHNFTCSNGNCAQCSIYPTCVPGASGCPWGAVWTDGGACN